MNYLAENVKYLMWAISKKKKLSFSGYEPFLNTIATGCGIPQERFRKALEEKAELTEEEIRGVKTYFAQFDSDRAPYLDCELLFQEDIRANQKELVLENILFLIQSIPWGDNKDFTDALEIRGSTLSRWKNGEMKPSRHFQAEICKYFGLGDLDDLKTAYLFFGLSPVTTPQRKLEWKKMIDELSRADFEAVYPALLKLLT